MTLIKNTPPQYKYALVTGASSGIGAAVAKKLAVEGIGVLLVARRLDKLVSLASDIQAAGGDAVVLQADLCLERDRLRVYQDAFRASESIDILVNNAGLGWYGYYDKMPWEVAAQLMELNITAVAHLTNLFLPQMRLSDRGHIINIGSIAGGFPNQGTALYSASKSFLDAFTTVIHRELRGTSVHCSIVRAGPVATEFFDQALKRPSGSPVPAEKFAVTPERVADRTWRLLKHPRKVIYVPGLLAVTPWVEILFGRIIDRLGPLLLKRLPASSSSH